jgi:hypothetical protein
MKGSKPRTPLRVIAGSGKRRSASRCPAWLPPEAKVEWQRAVQATHTISQLAKAYTEEAIEKLAEIMRTRLTARLGRTERLLRRRSECT